jgi:hypothetical protein
MDESTQSPENSRRSIATQDRTVNPNASALQTHTSTGEQSGAYGESGDRSGVKPATHAAGEKGNGADTGIVERVRERAGAQLATQKNMATDSIGTFARAVRRTTQELREQQHDTLAQYVDRAADQLERLSSGLKNKDVGDLVRDAQKVARRQPVVFVGSAFAIGLLGARFFKSSAPHRSHQPPAWQRMGQEADAPTHLEHGHSQVSAYGQPAPSNLSSTGPSKPGDVRSSSSNLASSAPSRQGREDPGAENR